MEKSKVYYTTMRTGFEDGLLNKLKRLIKPASETLILTENIQPSRSISVNQATLPISVLTMRRPSPM